MKAKYISTYIRKFITYCTAGGVPVRVHDLSSIPWLSVRENIRQQCETRVFCFWYYRPTFVGQSGHDLYICTLSDVIAIVLYRDVATPVGIAGTQLD